MRSSAKGLLRGQCVCRSVEKLRAAFEVRHPDAADAVARLAPLLGEDEDPERFWATVAVNLSVGRLRLIFVAGVIPPELRRVVEFLNEQMTQTELLALEIRYRRGNRSRG